jgi:hypothetical protein
MILSVAAMSGVEAPRTLKIKGLIQGVEMLLLIDYGSSHSVISEQVATTLQGVTGSYFSYTSASGKWYHFVIFI